MDSQPKKRGRPPGSTNKAKIDQQSDNNVMLKPSELCDIIKTCKQHGVLSLKFGGLKLIFPELNNQEVNPIKEQIVYPEMTPEESAVEREQRDQEAQIYDLELLSIEDPVAYERVMVGKESLDEDRRTQSLI